MLEILSLFNFSVERSVMTDSWDTMKKAKEDSYFEKKNNEALARLAKKENDEKTLNSPVTGEPMEKLVIDGIVVDKCTVSGGIWLDAGELEQLLAHSTQAEVEQQTFWTAFVNKINGK